jgi:PAS domain S-box-containing protein
MTIRDKIVSLTSSKETEDQDAIIAAINRAQAMISFKPDGTILDANENFLATIGYSLSEIKGKHHRMFCDTSYANSDDYRRLWENLGRGEFESGEFRRLGKGGKEVWINASYNPILDASGRVTKVVKFAVDVSSQKLRDSVLNALSKSQAVIEFNLDGSILSANDNFLKRKIAYLFFLPMWISGCLLVFQCGNGSEIEKSAQYEENEIPVVATTATETDKKYLKKNMTNKYPIIYNQEQNKTTYNKDLLGGAKTLEDKYKELKTLQISKQNDKYSKS